MTEPATFVLSTVWDAGVAVVSFRGYFLKKIAPPEGLTKFSAPYSAVLAGLAFLCVKLLAFVNHRSASLWGSVALYCAVLSVIFFIFYFFLYQTYTMEYGGVQRITGIYRSDKANNYSKNHPGISRKELLLASAGEFEDVWPAPSIRNARVLLTGAYCLFIATLSFALYLGVEVLNNTWKTPPDMPGPVPVPPSLSLKDVHFDLNKSDLTEDATNALIDDASQLKVLFQTQPQPGQSQPASLPTLIVEGFCDDQGSFQHNMTLGYRRAEAAKAVLAQNGIPVERIQTVSHGNTARICAETTESCRRKNRRVHLTVVK